MKQWWKKGSQQDKGQGKQKGAKILQNSSNKIWQIKSMKISSKAYSNTDAVCSKTWSNK